ncbi:acid-sensing ion channel 5 [Hyperolius riggenbachi]|uniref:acid-sensing ion channel 5 n=1 Tax=Hyperolius riggenbachi TaxID=752182 RepID=UPI0035A2FAE5
MDQQDKSSSPNNSALLVKIHSFVREHSAPSTEERKKYNREFAVSTSFHGLHNLVTSNTGTVGHIRRVLWSVVVLVCVCAASTQVFSRISNYFSRPTTTSVIIQSVDRIEFPSVTFCNLNRFQTSAVNNLSIALFMWNLVSTVLHFSNTEKNPEDMQEINDFLQLNQNFSIKDFTRNNGFYINNSTLLKCDFFGSPCYPEDFEHIFTEYGNCYTFNQNTPGLNKRVSTSGKGLSVLFDIKQTQFTDEPSLGFMDAGITFVIHSPNVPPRFDGLGLHSPVGMHAHASIRLFKTITQEYPWGECNPYLTLSYHEVYSTYGCLQECKATYIKDECGCLPFLLPGFGKECDLPRFYNCVYPALNKIQKLDLCTMGTYNSSCPVPCEEIDYPATLSYSTFPSDKAADFLSSKLSKDARYMRNNLVYIDIKYQKLNYKITEQQKALTSSELLSNVGGQLGLFCGASMITIIEILEFLLTYSFWLFAFLLLKIHNISQWTDRQTGYKEEIRES